jgi:hypothetical protein
MLTDAGLSPYLQRRMLAEGCGAVKDDRAYLQTL